MRATQTYIFARYQPQLCKMQFLRARPTNCIYVRAHKLRFARDAKLYSARATKTIFLRAQKTAFRRPRKNCILRATWESYFAVRDTETTFPHLPNFCKANMIFARATQIYIAACRKCILRATLNILEQHRKYPPAPTEKYPRALSIRFPHPLGKKALLGKKVPGWAQNEENEGWVFLKKPPS